MQTIPVPFRGSQRARASSSTAGIKKESVFPEPVFACASTSSPRSSGGMERAWISVSVSKPMSRSALCVSSSSLSESKRTPRKEDAGSSASAAAASAWTASESAAAAADAAAAASSEAAAADAARSALSFLSFFFFSGGSAASAPAGASGFFRLPFLPDGATPSLALMWLASVRAIRRAVQGVVCVSERLAAKGSTSSTSSSTTDFLFADSGLPEGFLGG